MAISLRTNCAKHIGLTGRISVIRDFFGYGTTLPPFSDLLPKPLPGTLSVLTQAKLLEGGQVLHLHLKVVWPLWRQARLGLTSPGGLPTIDEMIFLMRMVYGAHGIGVVVQSLEDLDLPPNFWDITIGSSEIDDLYDNNRHGVMENHLVLFFIRLLDPVANGVTHGGQHGSYISWVAEKWTPAHEIGHVLGLVHVDDDEVAEGGKSKCKLTRLMTGCGTQFIIVPLPGLSHAEVSTMKNHDATMSN